MADVVDDPNCAVCFKLTKSNEYAIACDGFCQKWYHIKCIDLPVSNYSQIQAVSDNIKWFCAKCEVRFNNLVAKVADIDDFLNLNSTVSKLVSIVKGVIDDNVLLNEKLDSVIAGQGSSELKSSSNTNKVLDSTHSNSASNKKIQCVSDTENQTLAVSDKTVKASTTEPNPHPHLGQHSANASQTDYEANFPSLISDVETPDNNSDWKYQRGRKHRKSAAVKKKPIIGTKVPESNQEVSNLKAIEGNQIGNNLKAVDKLNWIFVSRVHPECTKDDVLNHLRDSGIAGECVDLKPKHNSYKSFKIGVTSEAALKLLSSDFWPVNTLVKEFVQRPTSNFVPSRTFLRK
jgi:hypothetical protein